MMRKILCLLVCLTLMLSTIPSIVQVSGAEDDNTFVLFPDLMLKNQLIEAGADVNKDASISRGEMRAMTGAYIFWGIRSVSGLEYMTSISSLSLFECDLSDISPVLNLTALQSFSVSLHLFDTIPSFGTMTGLKELNIEDTNASDISPLSKMTNLNILSISGRNIQDIHPLKTLVNLSKLNINNCNISNIETLSFLKELTELSINGNSIIDISPLAVLTKLEKLEASKTSVFSSPLQTGDIAINTSALSSGNAISNISPLSGLSKLSELYLEGNPVSSIEPLSGHINLKHLNLSSTGLKSVDILSGLTNLESLYIYENEITDISPVSGLNKLTYLDFSRNSVDISDGSMAMQIVSAIEAREGTAVYIPQKKEDDSVSVVFADNDLKTALLDGFDVWVDSDINGIITRGECRAVLGSLYLNNYVNVSDLSGMEYFENITYLDISQDDVTDITPLKTLKNLTGLDLSWNPVLEISTLAQNLKLKAIKASNIPQQTIKDFPLLTNLRELDLSLSDYDNLSFLSEMKFLESLNISLIEVTDSAVISDLVNLQKLNISSTGISNISVLQNHVNMVQLAAENNGISDIGSLSKMTGLKELWLDGNNISDISVISPMIMLENISISDNNLIDISALSGMNEIQSLQLANNHINSISVLQNKKVISWLDLKDNTISDISALSGKKLMFLDISSNNLDVSVGSAAALILDELKKSAFEVIYLPQKADIDSTTPSPEPSITPHQTATPSPLPTTQVPFSDTKSHWAGTYIENLYSKSIIAGYKIGTDTVFKPNNSITRAEFAVVIAKALGLSKMTPEADGPTQGAIPAKFNDDAQIPEWASGYVYTLVSHGIITGYSDGSFKPSNRINRAELAVIIVRAKGETATGANGPAGFADEVKIPVWAKWYVSRAVVLNIVSGYSTQSEQGVIREFRPAGSATRAEVCVMITKGDFL